MCHGDDCPVEQISEILRQLRRDTTAGAKLSPEEQAAGLISAVTSFSHQICTKNSLFRPFLLASAALAHVRRMGALVLNIHFHSLGCCSNFYFLFHCSSN